jgi:hypothetical protein
MATIDVISARIIGSQKVPLNDSEIVPETPTFRVSHCFFLPTRLWSRFVTSAKTLSVGFTVRLLLRKASTRPTAFI